jgi:sugar phosphate isomerase/epimerase
MTPAQPPALQPVISSHIFSKQPLHPSQLDVLAATGAEAIELWASVQHFNYQSRPMVREVAQYFASSPLKLHSLHFPMYRGEDSRTRNNVVHRERGERIAAMDEVKRAIEVAEQAPFRFFILHLDEYEQEWSEAVLDHAMTSVEHLRAFARPLGVTLALENLYAGIAHPENLLQILNTGHSKDVGLCFDSGHAHMVAATRARGKSSDHAADGSVTATRDNVLAEYFAILEMMAPRIVTTHLHDNDSTRDAHLWPADESLEGNGVPWPETMRILAKAPHAPAANLEIHHSLGTEDAQIPQRAAEAFAMLTPR